jgi:hypothetical protein
MRRTADGTLLVAAAVFVYRKLSIQLRICG